MDMDLVEVWLLLWARGSLELGSLDLGADHAFAQESLVSQEELMVVAAKSRREECQAC